MKANFFTLMITVGTILLISSSCKKTIEIDLNAEYLGNYKIEYTYQYPYLDTNGWNYNTVSTVDNTCELTEDENGDLLLTNFKFFNDIPMHTYIENDSICVPYYNTYAGGASAHGYQAFGNIVDGQFILEIYSSYYDWSLMAPIGLNGTAIATKIN